MRKLKVSLIATLLVSSIAVAQERPTKAVQNQNDIMLDPVESLAQEGIGPVLIGGSEARAEEWPASFYSSAAGARCSATLVGPQALLLAAHCVGNGKRSIISFRSKTYNGKCTHAESYKNGTGDESADYALCFLTSPVEGLRYETINRDASRLKVKGDILLTGYGCTQAPAPGSNEPSGGNDGIFRIGSAKIIHNPGDEERNSIITQDEVVVCPGDSGGGAFYLFVSNPRRILVSVNSRVWYEKKRSYLSSMTTPDAVKFVEAWLKDPENKAARICGFNLSGPSCR